MINRRRFVQSSTSLLALAMLPEGGTSPAPASDAIPSHPLDPLTSGEIAKAVDMLKTAGKLHKEVRFATIELKEPAKHDLLRWRPGNPLRRQAFAILYDRATNQTFEAVSDLDANQVTSWREIHGVQPYAIDDDAEVARRVVRADPRWQEALHQRGIEDFDAVQVEPESAGYHFLEQQGGDRLLGVIFFYRGDSLNPYGRPISGLMVFVNLTTQKVFKFIDTGVTAVPKEAADFGHPAGGFSPEPKPLRITQPAGKTFEVHGHEVRWLNWRFRFGMTPREGLVLYNAAYQDQARMRPVLYRGSMSEMFVPYADPSPIFYYNDSYDEGDGGMGRTAHALEPGVDCPENAALFDAVFSDEHGRPFRIPGAVALYERDGGILWKHVDYVTGHNQSRRARDLVLSYIDTQGNYDYAVDWIFHQDAGLEIQVTLTGDLLTTAIPPGGPENDEQGEMRYGSPVSKELLGVSHQHIFCFRLDVDVDGVENSVMEMNWQPAPSGPANPHANAFVLKETPLENEFDAQRDTNPAANRMWRIINPSKKNALGQPVSYVLMPGENSVIYSAPECPVRTRAGFVNHHLWVTPYDASQQYAAGDYVNRTTGDDGLPQWVQARRPIRSRDVVLWYTMILTHTPRAEDWPVMPAVRAGFRLAPNGFFDQNPVLRAPKPK
ncbi:MAG: primary-amine oxidase [Terriglobia bacterium]